MTMMEPLSTLPTISEDVTNDAKAIRLFIVHDETIIRAALRLLIESQAGMRVVGEASGQSQSSGPTIDESPDIFLFDLGLGRESSLNYLQEFVLNFPNARVIVLTSAADTDLHQMAVISGASGIVMREHDPEVLVKAIQRVHAGELWLGRSLTTRLVTKLASSSVKKNDPEAVKIATLTKREKEIVMLVGKGLNSTIIAEQLGISEATVRNHLTSILDKLGVSNKFELAVYAFRNSLAGPSPAHT